MGVEVVTVEDLENFRRKLLEDIERLLKAARPKKWLKTREVAEMLDISEVTLQSLRNKGVIPFRKIGGICYYNVDELEEAIRKG